FIEVKLQNVQDLELAFQTMVIEIRSMAPSIAGAYPLEAASTSSLSFFSDVDRDGTSERVRYFMATSTIERGITEPSGNPPVYATSSEIVGVVITRVVTSTAATFLYYDDQYTGTQSAMPLPIDIQMVRAIRVGISADVNPGAPQPAHYERTITIRNLRSN
ncbi:MAG: hypothetical protein HY436_00040, partial [Candidatus Liptonbacteria bacterium]|nr:hypothetical protein [Candidatus Liptonbacteria bacterium]